MSAHRYWRLIGLSAQGNDSNLALTEIKLLSNSLSVSDTITPTSNYSPLSGTLAALTDSDLTNSVVFAKSALQSLTLSWDLVTNKDVTDIQFGSGLLQSEFLLSSTLQFSNDNLVWTTYTDFKAPKWPGSNSLTTSDLVNSYWDTATTDSNPAIAPDGTYVSPVRQKSIKGSIYRQTGICQFEVKFTSLSTDQPATIIYLGVGVTSNTPSSDNLQADKEAYSIYSTQAAVFANVSNQNYGSFIDGDVIGVVANFETGSLEFFINGVSKGLATTTGLLGKSIVPVVCDTAGFTYRNLHATLKINSFDYPITGAEPWATSPRLVIDKNIFRLYNTSTSTILFANTQAADGNLYAKQVFSGIVLFPNSQAASGNFSPKQVFNGTLGNYLDPGKGVIAGYVTISGGIPVSRKIDLYRESDGMLVRQMWSDPVTGIYKFEGLNTNYTYSVVGYDYTNQYKSSIVNGRIASVGV